MFFAYIPLIHIELVLHMIWVRGVIFFCRRSQLLVTIYWKLHHLSISTLDSYLPSYSWNILWNFASWSFCFKYMSLAPRKTASSRLTSNTFLLWFPLIQLKMLTGCISTLININLYQYVSFKFSSIINYKENCLCTVSLHKSRHILKKKSLRQCQITPKSFISLCSMQQWKFILWCFVFGNTDYSRY